MAWDSDLAEAFLAAYEGRGGGSDAELCAQVAGEEPREIDSRFGPCVPFSDPADKLVSPLDWLWIMCPLEVLTGDTSGGVGRCGVADLGYGATTVMEMERDFGVTPPFTSRIFGVGDRNDAGDNPRGPRGAEGGALEG